MEKRGGTRARERRGEGGWMLRRGWIIYGVTVFRGCCLRCQVGGSGGDRGNLHLFAGSRRRPLFMAPRETRYVSPPTFHTLRRPRAAVFCARYYIGIGYRVSESVIPFIRSKWQWQTMGIDSIRATGSFVTGGNERLRLC